MDDKLPHIERTEEAAFRNALFNSSNKSNNIIIWGSSGTGKTSIATNTLGEIIASKNNDDYLIVSLNLVDDDITPSAFIELLIFILWNGDIRSVENTINISKKDSFRRFINSKRAYKKMSKILFYSVQTIISAIPTYGAQISSFIGNAQAINASYEIDKTDLLQKYFKKISKKKRIVLLIDNYQIMIPQMRILFESILSNIKENITLVTIFRVDEYNEFKSPLCFNDTSIKINVGNFTKQQTINLFFECFGNTKFVESAAIDCYSNTKGNAKEIDLYIRRNKNGIENKSLKLGTTKDLKNLINNLPEIQRFIILLSSLFPSGIKVDYIYNFVNQNYIADQTYIEIEMQKLITLGYIIINSTNNNILKPAHDRIIINANRIQSDEDFIELYRSIESTLESLILKKTNDPDYTYLLHCLIGVCSYNDLRRNINYLIELITIEYNNCSYFYITEIISSMKEIIVYLPETSLIQLLDACQKSSEFALGLYIYNTWSNENKNLSNKHILFAVKFLTQTYDFEQAYSLISLAEANNETLLYELNILQHQTRDDLAAEKIHKLINSPNVKDKFYYIILRNSAHYFSYKRAKENLLECCTFFERYGTAFEKATIYNNLSVIEIWNGNKTFHQAKNNIKKSIDLHKNIHSNEIFEPYCNYSVLMYLEGKYDEALKYANLSLDELPHRLELDVIIISINKLIYEAALNLITIEKLYEELKKQHSKPIIFKDPWVEFQVSYNLHHIELELFGQSDIAYSDYFLKKRETNTSLEVLSALNIGEKEISVTLSLSPNWRY